MSPPCGLPRPINCLVPLLRPQPWRLEATDWPGRATGRYDPAQRGNLGGGSRGSPKGGDYYQVSQLLLSLCMLGVQLGCCEASDQWSISPVELRVEMGWVTAAQRGFRKLLGSV